jgi:hypothetical protein
MMVAMTGEPVSGGVPGPAGRWRYPGDPDAPGSRDWQAGFDNLAGPAYVAARSGSLDAEMAFDLACFLVDENHPDLLATKLAEQAATGTDRSELSKLALQVLADAGFEPGFTEEPSLLEALERALRVVEADVRATGLDGPVGLILNDITGLVQHAHAVFRGGGSGSTTGIHFSQASDPRTALVAVADDLQNSVMHILWGTVWPVCPAHNLGAHAREHQRTAVWWCNGAGGHVIVAIGKWRR